MNTFAVRKNGEPSKTLMSLRTLNTRRQRFGCAELRYDVVRDVVAAFLQRFSLQKVLYDAPHHVIPESCGAIAQPPRGGDTEKIADPSTQHAQIGFKQ